MYFFGNANPDEPKLNIFATKALRHKGFYFALKSLVLWARNLYSIKCLLYIYGQPIRPKFAAKSDRLMP